MFNFSSSQERSSARTTDRAIALVVTVLVHALIVIAFVWTFIAAPTLIKPLAEEDDAELILEPDEYTIPADLDAVKQTGGQELIKGDDPAASSDDASAPALDDRVATAPDEVRAKPADQPSKGNTPVKTTPKEDKKSAEEIARAKAKEQADREKAERDARAAEIRNSVKFNGAGSGSGKQGVANGNSDKGATAGAPGHDLSGRTVEAWGKPSSTSSGVIRIRVRVNPQGKVTSARYVGGDGAAAANPNVRTSCEQASLKSKFSVATDNAKEQIGIITWRFQ